MSNRRSLLIVRFQLCAQALKIFARGRVVRVDAQRLLEMRHRLFEPPKRRERFAEVVMRVGVLRVATNSLLEVRDRLREIASNGEDLAEIVLRVGVMGSDA